MFVAGDVTHFDMAFTAFERIALFDMGVVDVEFTRVPRERCRTPEQGVNADTCNTYWGTLVSEDLWKLFVGIGVCACAAAVVSFLFVKFFYGFGRAG